MPRQMDVHGLEKRTSARSFRAQSEDGMQVRFPAREIRAADQAEHAFLVVGDYDTSLAVAEHQIESSLEIVCRPTRDHVSCHHITDTRAFGGKT